MPETGASHSTIEYRVDGNNVIVDVRGPWRELASANGAPELAEPIGQDLLETIAGGSTRMVTKDLLDRVRATRRTVEIPFRCDAPDRRRFMRLRLLPVGERGIAFRSWLVREEERPPVRILDIQEARSDELLKICSWCKKVDADGEWLELEEAADRLALFEAPLLPDLTHGICDECERTLSSAI